MFSKIQFSFTLLRHYQMPKRFYFNKSAVFELAQWFHHATKIGNVANAVSTCADQP